MQKKEESRKNIFSSRYYVRLIILMSPATIILVLLALFGHLSPLAAFLYFLLVFLITAIITAWVFIELENFTAYLRHLAQEFDSNLPKFKFGVFGPKQLSQAFIAVKNRWSEQLLSDSWILQNMPVAIMILDANKNIVFANQSLFACFKNVAYHSPPPAFFMKKYAADFKAVFSGKKGNTHFKWVYGSKAFQVRVERLPAQTKGGGIVAVVFQDITSLEQLNQQQTDFIANASHELKTPLSIIAGFTETLRTTAKNDPEAQDLFLKLIEQQTQKMTGLVQNLLMSAQKNFFTRKNNVKLELLLQSLIQSFLPKATQHQKKINLVITPNAKNLTGDFGPLFNVYQNILDNAIKYGTPDSTITIKADVVKNRNQSSLVVSFHNFGNPIPPQEQKRIFERFYRIPALAYNQEGTGLGLGIAKKIMTDLHGTIHLTSSQGKGTCFKVVLPLK